MIDIEPSLDRSTEIFGLELLESPEDLQGFGVLSVAKKLADSCAKEGHACVRVRACVEGLV